MPVRKTSSEPRKTPPSSRKLPARIAQSIGERILNGTYAPGTLLPNEAEWGRMFGVSRTAVREAIKTLNGKGLLASRPKIGSRVEPRVHWNLLDRDVLAWHSRAKEPKEFLLSVQEIRKIIEPEIAALAARRHTPEQLLPVAEALAQMKTAKTPAASVAPDVRFHLGLLAACNNEMLIPLGIVIESALASLFKFTAQKAPALGPALKLHENVYDCVRLRDEEGARRAAQVLLTDTDATMARAGVTEQRKPKIR